MQTRALPCELVEREFSSVSVLQCHMHRFCRPHGTLLWLDSSDGPVCLFNLALALAAYV